MSLQYLLSYMVSDEKSSINLTKVFAGGSDGKESACNEGDLGSIPGLGRSTGGGHGKPL